MVLYEHDIRATLHNVFRTQFSNAPTTLVLDELCICWGKVIADIVVITDDHLLGFEIKGDTDTLTRLPKQVDKYDKIFDYNTLVCSRKFLDKLTTIPPWWGVICVEKDAAGQPFLTTHRQAERNTAVSALLLLELLWKEELARLAAPRRTDSWSRTLRLTKYQLIHYVADNFSLDEVRNYVRDCLRARTDWKYNALERSGANGIKCANQ